MSILIAYTTAIVGRFLLMPNPTGVIAMMFVSLGIVCALLTWFAVTILSHRRRILSAEPADGRAAHRAARVAKKSLAFGDFRASAAYAATDLFREDCEGIVLVIRPRCEPFPIDSLAAESEPVPLDESDLLFRRRMPSPPFATEDDGVLAGLGRFAQRLGGVGHVTIALCLLPQVINLTTQVTFAPGAPMVRPFVFLLLALVVFAAALLVLIRGRASHFLVPGGIILRSGFWWSASSRLSYARAIDAALVVLPLSDGSWRFQLKQRGAEFGKSITRREAEMLIRFWLSATESPSEAQVREILG
ncbi:MAG: hypothetical protein ACKVS9_17700 [Phycisphaerae bacterium]